MCGGRGKNHTVQEFAQGIRLLSKEADPTGGRRREPSQHTFDLRVPRAAAKSARRLKATEQPIDTSTAAGKCFLDMLGVFAEFETNLRRERQLEGIAKAKAAGVYKGRPASIDAAQVRSMKAQGLGRLGDREGPQDRAGVGLPGAGSRLML